MNDTGRTIFEKSHAGCGMDYFPKCQLPPYELPASCQRTQPLHLPEVSEGELSRHYTELENKAYGVNDGCYPLGSCTMKYNPKLSEQLAALDGFTQIHPLQPDRTVQGCLEVYARMEKALCQITGMDAFSMQPAAGAHGELTGLLMILAYHKKRGDRKRTKILIPDSAHGTNPASAAMAGYQVVTIASDHDGCVNLGALKAAADDQVAGLMLTNPNTVGLFDKNILTITKIVHDCGGLTYYDGANLNAIMGIARPGDMGFDVMHVNLHKTFATPHGGGGPGSGPVGCKKFLQEFLPSFLSDIADGLYVKRYPYDTIGQMKSFYGNFLVVVKALTYIMLLGCDGLKKASQNAVLNANYMRVRLKDTYRSAYDATCMHEFVVSLSELKNRTGVSAVDIAKGLIDRRIHPPTMYFPLIVPEALMIEPTETESKETMDRVIEVLLALAKEAYEAPENFAADPKTTPVGRLDEVKAARTPKLRYEFTE